MSKQRQRVFQTVMHSASGDDAEMTISTADVDREGDVVVPEGGRFDNYLKNPVVLFGHDRRSIPVGTATSLQVEPGKGVRARWRWLQGDAFADRVRNAYEQGVLRAASIGFIPRDYDRQADGYRFTDWELVEFSLVPVPANPSAVRTLKRLGLDIDPEVTRAETTLQELGELLRAGRPLSVRDMARLQAATTLLTETRDHLETREDNDEDDGDMTVTIDGQDVRLTQASLDAAIKQIVSDEMAKAMGRVPDPVVEFEPDEDDLMELDEQTIVTLVGDVVREQLRTLMGRVD